MSYAAPTDFITRYDVRTLGDLVEDIGSRVTSGALTTDTHLQAVLDDAAGRINAACLIGQRYRVTDLQGLTGVDQALLLRVNCDLAFGYLNLRRGNDPAKFPSFVQAEELLAALKDGKAIFNVAGDVAASLPAIQFPSIASRTVINALRDAASRYFPQRSQQAPASN